MDEKQIRYNISAFKQDLKRFTAKYARARTPHTKAYWEAKMRETERVLWNNQERLLAFTQEES